MKQNVVLFSILAIGVLYIFYGTEKKHTSLEKVQNESLSANPDESETRIYHTRKLLSFADSQSNLQEVDSAWTSVGSLLEDTNNEQKLLGKETSQNLGVINKFTRRRKRRVPNPEKQFAWKFNLNVTRYENNGTSNNLVAFPTPSDEKESKSEDRYLGMAMSVSGNGPNQSVDDLYQAWDSVGQFLRTLFGGNLEELKDKGHGVSVDVDPLPNGTVDLPPELFLEGSGDEESQESRNRKGKFLLGLFGFGGNQGNPPRDEGSGDLVDIQEFNSTESEIQFANETKENEEVSTTLKTIEDQISSISTVFPIENQNLKESVTSSLILDQTPATTSDPGMALKITLISSIGEEAVSDVNCTDCELQTEMFASTENKRAIPTLHTLVPNTITTNFPLNDEALKDFCTALFSRMRTSGRSMKESENSEGSGSFEIAETSISDATNVNTQASKVLTDKPRSQNLGFLESIWNQIMGRRVAPVQEESLIESRGARLINFGNFLEFGSGRSADLGENSNMVFDNLDVDTTGNFEDSEQFLLDCEEFLKSVQTETRPNILDLVNPHTMESFTTEFITRSDEKSQLDENEKSENLIKEIPFNFESTTHNEVVTVISSISKTDNIVKDQTSSNWPNSDLATQMQDEQFEENKDRKHFTEATQLEDLVFTEVQEKVQNDSLSVQNLVLENINESQEFPTTGTSDISILINVTEIQLTTDESNGTNLKEDRSFIFDLGSGDEGSSDISNTKGRGGPITFGSGGREINEIDISTEESSAKTTDSSKERSLEGLINLGSGEREIKEMAISTEQSTGETTITSNERSLSLNIDLGSGARELDNLNSSKFDDNEDLLTSTITNEGRLLGWNSGFGSGERELRETAELTTVKNETESLLFFPSTEESNMTTRISSITNSFRVEITDQSITSNTNVPLDEPDKSDIYKETNETKDERSFGLNISGSGDGREISDLTTNTEDVNCVDCLSEQNTSVRTECDGCGRILNDSDIFTILDTSTVKNSATDEISPENKLCTYCEETNRPMVQEGSSAPVSILDRILSSTDALSREDANENRLEVSREDANENRLEVSREDANENRLEVSREDANENRLEVNTDMIQRPFPKPRENPSNDDITKMTSESTTVKNKSPFLETLLLTGSGDGGLFVDNKGPINLVEESEFTSPPVFQQSIQPRRGARKHDHLEFQEPTERFFEATKTTPFRSTTESNFPISQTPTDKSTLNTFVTKKINETETNSVSLQINDEIVTSVASTSTVQTEFSEVTVISTPTATSTSTPSTTTKNVSESVTTIGVMVSTLLNIKPRSKVTEPPQRFCTSASQCNRDLNERCIFDGPTAMCNCGRSYVRSPETGKCESPVVLKTSLKLPGEAFHHDLNNRNSDRFRKMANDSIVTMWILLGDDPELFRIVAGVDVSGFEEGSLVVHWEITLAAPENESVAELIEQLDAELKEAFEDEALLRRAPLNVHNAVLMAVTNDIDPCEKTELNYCSKNADCFRDPMRGFKCRCKEDYLDQSTDMNHPGELCIATCPPYYCGDHGECNLKQNGDLHCSCNSWYFGEKCEISGIVVIAGFASFNVLLIIIVLFLVCYCRKRRYRQSKFYDQNQVRFQPEAELGRFTGSPRLADTIALSDVGPMKTSKYMAISTPMHNPPTIRLTSPSILGSSVDYDYDSTFDRTPSVEEINVEVHKSGTTPKV